MSDLTLAEIAERIRAHLRRAEADAEWNRYEYVDPKGQTWKRSHLYSAGAGRAGRYVRVTYISYQGSSNLSRERAKAYLAWLDAGNRGRHYEAEKDAA